MQTTSDPQGAVRFYSNELRDGFSSEESSILEDIQHKVGVADSLDDVMNLVFESTLAISPCDRIGLAFLEEDGQLLTLKWVRTLYTPTRLNLGYSASIDKGSLVRVIAKGHPRVINDLEAYLRQNPRSESTRLLLREGVRSNMTCPLRVEGRTIGVMFRSSRQANAYDEHQMALHLAIEERLSQTVDKAYRIDQLTASKEAFAEILGFVSHELKNALTTVNNDTWALHSGRLGELTSMQQDLVERIQAKTGLLENLIRQYLDLARLDDDGLSLQVVEESNFYRDVIAPVVDMYRSMIERKGMSLSLISDDRDVRVACDPDMMKIVLANLLGNAIKYGDEGGDIRIRWQQAGNQLRMSVFNTGPGFLPEQRSMLFRRFSRLETAGPTRRPGTGLGLYNVRRIVKLHDGMVHAVSNPGRWAEFSVEIPLSVRPSDANITDDLIVPVKKIMSQYFVADSNDADVLAGGPQKLAIEDGSSPTPRKPKILVIDDDPDIVEAVVQRLGSHGIDVVSSLSGMQGYWKSLETHPDVILMDMVMPDGEGNYIYSRFKGHPLTENTPVIVLTGQNNPAMKREMLSLGVWAYLAKPIPWDDLLDELHRLIDFSHEPSEESVESASIPAGQ